MDTLFLVLLLVLLTLFALPIVAIRKVNRLQRRVVALSALLHERSLGHVAVRAPRPEPPEPSQETESAEPAEAVEKEPAEPQEQPADPSIDRPADATGEGPPQIPLPGPGAAAARASRPLQAGDIETAVGTKWTVWIGGVALALGGIFLVRYSIEQGLIGPAVRTALGALFALCLAAAGELARRRDIALDFVGPRSAYVPGVLTAAGILTGFATIYAAYALYGFLGALPAFVLLAACSMAGLAASSLHGPSLAALGLVGSYATPALVASETPNPWVLFIYLLFVTAATYFVASLRGWLWLAISAAVGATLWGLSWCGGAWRTGDIYPLGVYLLTLAAFTLLLLTHDPEESADDATPWSALDRPIGGILVAITFVVLPAVRLDGYSNASLVLLAAACAFLLAGAWRWRNLALMVAWSAALFGLVYLTWHIPTMVTAPIGPFDTYMGVAPIAPPGLQRFLLVGALFGAGFAAVGAFAALRSRSHPVWTLTAAAAPIVIFAYAYFRATHFEHSVPFGTVGLGMAGLFAIATKVMQRRGGEAPWPWRSGVFAAAAVAALALACTIVLEKGWLTIALALICPGLAWISSVRPVPNLRYLAAGLAVVVALRLLYDPIVVGDALGRTPILNWLLYGYGLPAIAFAASASLFRRQADDRVVQIFEAAAILFTVALIGLQVRHLVNDGNVYAPTLDLAELSIHSIVWIGLAIGLQRLHGRLERPMLDHASSILGAIGLVTVLAGHLLLKNPLFTGEDVGDNRLFNTLLLAYVVPGLLCGVLHRMAQGRRHELYVSASGGAALLLIFAYVTLEIRMLFHGPVLTTGPTTDGELYAYSAVWLLYGIGLFMAGVVTGIGALRTASVAVIVLTICKVFLFDLANLEGILRAASFIGLGLTLVGIGYFYQKFMVPRASGPTEPEPDDGATSP